MPIESPSTQTPETGIAAYAHALIGARRLVVTFILGSMFAAAALALALPKRYTAEVLLLPTDSGKKGIPAGLGGLSAAFGLQVPSGWVSQSDLYPAILMSDHFLGELVHESFASPPSAPPRPLGDLLVDPAGLSKFEHRALALNHLRKNVLRAHKNSDDGVVSLRVTTDLPVLSSAVANRLTSLLETYLVDTRQDEGSRDRTIVDTRLDVVTIDLQRAEASLVEFRLANRRMAGSPGLILQEERLHREVRLQEQVLLELQRQKEGARIQEVKSSPVLKILDVAHVPIHPSRPHAMIAISMGFALGLFTIVGCVVTRTALALSPAVAVELRPIQSDWRRVRRAMWRERPTHVG